MEVLRDLNLILAGIGLFGALGSVAAMDGRTNHLVRLAILMLLIGLAAQLIGPLSQQWDHWADTLTFGGIAVLLLSSRRLPTCFIDRYSPQIAAFVGAAATLATLIAWSATGG